MGILPNMRAGPIRGLPRGGFPIWRPLAAPPRSKAGFAAALLAGVLLFAAGAARAQDPANRTEISRFEVVSVKPDNLAQIRWCIPAAGARCRRTGLWTMSGLPVTILIALAYDLPPKNIAGGENWVNHLRFAVSVKVEPGVSDQQFRLMMQTMLADRFGLRGHVDSQEEDVVSLGVVKSQSPPPATKDCAVGTVAGPPGQGRMVPCGAVVEFWQIAPADSQQLGRRELVARSVTMADFAAGIGSRHSPYTVLNETNLNGRFDLDVTFNATQNQFSYPTQQALGKALRRQAGLAISFRPVKRLRPGFVIDHIHLPTPN